VDLRINVETRRNGFIGRKKVGLEENWQEG